jgi:hypothetical protein
MVQAAKKNYDGVNTIDVFDFLIALHLVRGHFQHYQVKPSFLTSHSGKRA